MSVIIGIKANNAIYDTQSAEELGLKGEPIYFDNSEESLAIMRHTCAHLMAEAIKALYPEAQFFVGPVVEEGFYYDFRIHQKISEEDLSVIESK
ncbi:MAG: threonine--tRNA ligase, partial [Helicobacter sp.]|nr:threonine--tRNA ligase [Helicobacter sp.]